jgi:hypothetical protein
MRRASIVSQFSTHVFPSSVERAAAQEKPSGRIL